MLITSIFLSSRRHQSLDVIITISLCRNYSAFRLNLSVVTPPPPTHTHRLLLARKNAIDRGQNWFQFRIWLACRMAWILKIKLREIAKCWMSNCLGNRTLEKIFKSTMNIITLMRSKRTVIVFLGLDCSNLRLRELSISCFCELNLSVSGALKTKKN